MSKRKNRQNQHKKALLSRFQLTRAIKSLKYLKEFFTALILLVGLYIYWPNILVVPSSSWDSSNPLQSSFEIKNESSLFCYKVVYTIGSSITVSSDAVLGVPEESVIPELCKNEGHTISIEKILSTSPNSIDNAEVYINLTYRPTFAPITFPKKSFRFKARKTSTGYIWERMYMDRKAQ